MFVTPWQNALSPKVPFRRHVCDTLAESHDFRRRFAGNPRRLGSSPDRVGKCACGGGDADRSGQMHRSPGVLLVYDPAFAYVNVCVCVRVSCLWSLSCLVCVIILCACVCVCVSVFVFVIVFFFFFMFMYVSVCPCAGWVAGWLGGWLGWRAHDFVCG